ncbi:MAG TPA: hypothetical protein VK762_03960 [Polyangiaceae bacterium]|jgi:hypothetical protein|nr:hypothetical protein [Polyangiaceae bacterium]
MRRIALSLGALSLAAALNCGGSDGAPPGHTLDTDASAGTDEPDGDGVVDRDGADDGSGPIGSRGDGASSTTDSGGADDSSSATDSGETDAHSDTVDSGDAGGPTSDGSTTSDGGSDGSTTSDGGSDGSAIDSGGADASPTPSIIVTPTSGLTTTENGGTATFTVQLGSDPTGMVSIVISSSNTTHGTVSPSVVTFTGGPAGDWATPQTVTITGVDDHTVTGDLPYSIITAPAVSTNPSYNGLNPPDVSVTSIDESVAAIVLSRTSGLVTTEGGGTATFTVQLNTSPSASVTIGLSSDNVEDGTVSPSSVVFSSANWNVARTVTVTGVETNTAADGSHSYHVVTAPAVSADANYNALNAADVSVTNEDDDVNVYAGKAGQLGSLGFCTTPSCAVAGSTLNVSLTLKGSVNFFLANAGDTHGVASSQTTAPSWFPSSALSATTAVTLTPTTTGAFPFLCTVHGSEETGTITVSP